VAQPIAFTRNTRDEVRQINGDGSIVGALGADCGMHQTNYVAQPIGIDGGEVAFARSANASHSGDKGDGGMNTTMVAERAAIGNDARAGRMRGREGCAGGGKGPLLSEEKSLTLAANANDQVLFQPQSLIKDGLPAQRIARPTDCPKSAAHCLTARTMAADSTAKMPTPDESSHVFRMVAFGEYVGDGTASAMKMRDYKDATDLAVTGQGGFFNESKTDTHGIPGNWIGRAPENGGNAVEPMNNLSPNLTRSDRHGGQTGMAVRRLTPRECERLQGFPDDYTLVAHRNKPAADGPRYKALGNSMAVPVMRWIGERIELVESIINTP
jgi:DNA (cytosine-5)-methyltransferase 1